MTQEKRPDRGRGDVWFSGGILLALFVYGWQGVRSHLLYFGFGVFADFPVFAWTWPFWGRAFSAPGRPLQALAALLANGYYSDLLGALIIATVLGLLFLGIRALLQLAQAEHLSDLAWGPAVMALMLYNRYDDPLVGLLGLVLSVGAAVLLGRFSLKTWYARAGLFFVGFLTVYYLSAGAAFVFLSLVVLLEIFLWRRRAEALLHAVLALGMALGLAWRLLWPDAQPTYLVGTPWHPATRSDLSVVSNRLQSIMFVYVPVLLLLACLWSALRVRYLQSWRDRRQHRKRRKKTTGQVHSRPVMFPAVGVGLRMALVGGSIVLCVLFSRSYVRHERLLHYHAYHRDWPKVLALADSMQGRVTFTRSGIFDINRASAHLGVLGETFCSYPQNKSDMLFLNDPDMRGALRHAKCLELALDLGDLNGAERLAYELLEKQDANLHALGAIVRVHVAKGQWEAARVVLGALKRQVGWTHYLGQWSALLDTPQALAEHAHIKALQQVKRTTNTLLAVSDEHTLLNLHRDRPGHRLVLDYLMAYYLLEHQRDKFVRYLPEMRSLGYARLPRHHAEALLLYALESKTPIERFGWTIDPGLHRQFQQARATMARAGSTQAAYAALAPLMGDSYTFYSVFDTCGVK